MAKTSLNTCLNKRRLKKSKGSREDRLSNLSDDLLCRILSELSTKDSIRTSLLSKRWRNLWSSVPVLDLDTRTFRYDDYLFWEFLDSFLESNEEQDIKRFKLIYDAAEHCHSDFVWRIDDVVKRRVCHLTVLNRVDDEEAYVRMPLSLYSCVTLVSLTLYCVVFDDPGSESVSLPCVKTMHLEAIKFDGKTLLGALISSCSVLEELIIVTHPGDYLGVVCVRSQSLKSFELESTRGGECEDERQGDPKVVIDAPRLKYMSISRYQSKSIIIHSIGSYAKVNIDAIFDVEYDDPLKIAMIQNFLIGISMAHEMIISARTLKVIHGFSELEPLPQFPNLSRLDALFIKSFWELLPTFLGCCLNLQSLVLEFDSLPERDEMKVSYVPQCFLSSLEYVHLCTPTTVTEPSNKMKLPIYFVRNCAVLKKFVLNESFGNIIKKIKRIPKLSQGCEVVMGKPTYEGVSHKYDLVSIMYQIVS